MCSFCLRPKSAGIRLVVGPGVAICSDCALGAAKLFGEGGGATGERAAAGSAGNTVDESPTGDGLLRHSEQATLAEVLGHLKEIESSIDGAHAYLRHWVQAARDKGGSWAAIGQALGISRQSAWERFT